jgi:hypothetical protein
MEGDNIHYLIPDEIFARVAWYNYGAYRGLVCACKRLHAAIYNTDWRNRYTLYDEGDYKDKAEDCIIEEMEEPTLTWYKIISMRKSVVHIWSYMRESIKYYVTQTDDTCYINSITRTKYTNNSIIKEQLMIHPQLVERLIEYSDDNEFLTEKVSQTKRYTIVYGGEVSIGRRFIPCTEWVVKDPFFVYNYDL